MWIVKITDVSEDLLVSGGATTMAAPRFLYSAT